MGMAMAIPADDYTGAGQIDTEMLSGQLTA